MTEAEWSEKMTHKEAQIKIVTEELKAMQLDREEARQIVIKDFQVLHDGKMNATTFKRIKSRQKHKGIAKLQLHELTEELTADPIKINEY